MSIIAHSAYLAHSINNQIICHLNHQPIELDPSTSSDRQPNSGLQVGSIMILLIYITEKHPYTHSSYESKEATHGGMEYLHHCYHVCHTQKISNHILIQNERE